MAGYTPLGWIGLGAMGMPMAQRLLDAGHELVVWARRPEAARPLLARGATLATDPPDLARRCRQVCTILRSTADVVEIHTALAAHLAPQAALVDLTTAAPEAAQRLAPLMRTRDIRWIDSPVTGGVKGAREGRLSLFVGGAQEDLAAVQPVLAVFGPRIVACGPAGSGYRMKLINQVIMAGALLGVAQGAAMARAAQLPAETAYAAMAQGSASGWMFEAYLEKMIRGDGAVGFTLGMLHKDLRLAQEALRELHLPQERLEQIVAAVAQAGERHGWHAGVQALAWL